jgi:hypothetical protein
MSFETIRIQRSQPIIDKKYVKIPGRENFESPPVDYNVALDNMNNVDAISLSTGIIPNYQKNLNLDFIVYAEVGLDGKLSGDLVDFQQELRDVSESQVLNDSTIADSAVYQWIENVYNDGGDAGSVSAPALRDLTQSLVDLGVWNNFRHIWPLAGDDLVAALVPLKGNMLINTNFVNGDYTRISGLTGGSGKYLDTQYIPVEATGGIVADFLNATPFGSSDIAIGCRRPSATHYFAIWPVGANIRWCWGGSGYAAYNVGSIKFVDVYNMRRSAANDQRLYLGGIEVDSDLVNDPAVAPTVSLLINGLNRQGTGPLASSAEYRFGIVAITDGLIPDSLQDDVADIIATYRTALGRS